MRFGEVNRVVADIVREDAEIGADVRERDRGVAEEFGDSGPVVPLERVEIGGEGAIVERDERAQVGVLDLSGASPDDAIAER